MKQPPASRKAPAAPAVGTVLIIDDEPDLLHGLSRSLARRVKNTEFLTASGIESALRMIRRHTPDLVLLDIKLGRDNGMELLDKLLLIDGDMTVVMMTAFGSIELAVEAMRRGAWDFVTKPLDLHSLGRLVTRGLERNTLKRHNQRLLSRLEGGNSSVAYVGNSIAIQRLRKTIEVVAKTHYTVLIRGASGTGKEIAAQMIHQLSCRAGKAFVMVNCPAIPEHLLESELFGHCRGAFTGADSDHDGLFAQADGGTICLDEIGDIQLSLQTKLLRFLQSKEIRKLGGNASQPVDVRIISSTNQNLEKKIADRSFREDLFYRLNVVNIHTPRLEDITEDIALISDHFLSQTCLELDCPRKALSPEAVSMLVNLKWPGNVRQLQNVMRRAAMFCPDEIIEPEHLANIDTALSGGTQADNKRIEPYKEAKERYFDSFSKRYVRNVLQQTKGNISQAARISGLTRAALQRIMKRHGLVGASFKTE